MKLKTSLKYPLLLSTFLLSASAVQAADIKLTHKKQMTLSRIIDGVVTRAGERPWMASLQHGGEHFCGGSVIDRQWILTAAHCIEDMSQGDSSFTVRVNFTNLTDTSAGESHQVEAIYAHEGYANGESKDIALLKLKTAISDAVPAVALANENTMLEAAKPGEEASVSGWGNTSTTGEEFPQELRNVEVPIVSNEVCNSAEAYGGQIQATEMCAGFAAGGKDSCQGDSGGPLVVRENGEFVQAGVVSWGDGCAQPNKYGVYARVASFNDWIGQVKAGQIEPGTGGGNGGGNGGDDGDWGDGGWGDIPADGTLISGLPVTGLSGESDSAQGFQIEVPEGARILWVDIKGDNGDADLYLQMGEAPSTEMYEYAPFKDGSTEHILVRRPESGTWHIMIHGYAAYEKPRSDGLCKIIVRGLAPLFPREREDEYLTLIVLAIVSVAACAAKQTTPEPVYGLQVIDIHADFIVRSTGCTKAEDFALEITEQSIKLVRLKADTCRRAPYLKTIRMPLPNHNRGKAILNPVFLGKP